LSVKFLLEFLEIFNKDTGGIMGNVCKTLYSWNAPKLLIIAFLTDSTLSEEVLTS
jgi:hypothetical protein